MYRHLWPFLKSFLDATVSAAVTAVPGACNIAATVVLQCRSEERLHITKVV